MARSIQILEFFVNVLILVNDILYYTRTMVREFVSLRDAFGRNPNYHHVVLWGPGFDGWEMTDLQVPLDRKIQEKFLDRDYFDLIVLFPGNQFNTSYYHREPGKSKKTALVMYLFEGRDYMSLTTIDHYWLDIAFYPSSTELYYDTLTKWPSWQEMVVSQLTQVADLRCSGDVNSFKPTDILYTGKAEPKEFYPIRERFLSLIQRGLLNAKVRSHPGYFLQVTDEDIIQRKVDLDIQDAQFQDYIHDLQTAKIALCGGSLNRVQTTRIFEAALAGALVVGDIPADEESILRKFMVDVSPDESDERIVDTIHWWLDHEERRRAKALVGQKIVLEKYTWDAAVEKTMECYNRWRAGKYGVWFSEFTLYEDRMRNTQEPPKIEPWYSSYGYKDGK